MYMYPLSLFHSLSLSSEFELPWFDLDAREEKESVRTTRSKARTTRHSVGSSGGWNTGLHGYGCSIPLTRKLSVHTWAL